MSLPCRKVKDREEKDLFKSLLHDGQHPVEVFVGLLAEVERPPVDEVVEVFHLGPVL
jgi:hypothetical protein